MSDFSQDLFGKFNSVFTRNSHPFVIVSIDDCHKFAEIVSFKESDNFELSDVFMFSKIEIYFCQNPSHRGIEKVFNCIVSSSR